MSEKEKLAKEPSYKVEGISIHAYLDEAGEFRWVPASQACSDVDNARKTIDLLKKMPADRRVVWVKRLDTDQAKAKCPIMKNDARICGDLDELCATYGGSNLKETNKKEGKTSNE